MRFLKNYICPILFFIVLACAGSKENTIRDEPDPFIAKFSGGPIIPENANTIYIAQIENSTNIHGLSQTLGMALRRQIAIEGRLAVIDNYALADLILIVRINSYRVQNLEFNRMGAPSRQRLRITGTASLFNRQTQTFIFRDNEVQSFKVFSQEIMPIQSELQCREDVLRMMADRIHLMIRTGWYSELLTEIERGRR